MQVLFNTMILKWKYKTVSSISTYFILLLRLSLLWPSLVSVSFSLNFSLKPLISHYLLSSFPVPFSFLLIPVPYFLKLNFHTTVVLYFLLQSKEVVLWSKENWLLHMAKILLSTVPTCCLKYWRLKCFLYWPDISAIPAPIRRLSGQWYTHPFYKRSNYEVIVPHFMRWTSRNNYRKT